MSRIIAIGDMHCPWVSKPCLDFIYAVVKQVKPSLIIQVGDSVDFYSHSRYPKSQFITPQQELIEGRATLEEFWKYLRLIAPQAKLHQMLGNHCVRPIKLSQEHSPSLEQYVREGMNSFFKFEGVTTHYDVREEIILDDILFTHGHYSGLGKHLNYYRRNVVCGHTHKGGVVFENSMGGKIIWELNVGYCADPSSKVMTYTATKYSKSTLGVGIIINSNPQFVPFQK